MGPPLRGAPSVATARLLHGWKRHLLKQSVCACRIGGRRLIGSSSVAEEAMEIVKRHMKAKLGRAIASFGERDMRLNRFLVIKASSFLLSR